MGSAVNDEAITVLDQTDHGLYAGVDIPVLFSRIDPVCFMLSYEKPAKCKNVMLDLLDPAMFYIEQKAGHRIKFDLALKAQDWNTPFILSDGGPFDLRNFVRMSFILDPDVKTVLQGNMDFRPLVWHERDGNTQETRTTTIGPAHLSFRLEKGGSKSAFHVTYQAMDIVIVSQSEKWDQTVTIKDPDIKLTMVSSEVIALYNDLLSGDKESLFRHLLQTSVQANLALEGIGTETTDKNEVKKATKDGYMPVATYLDKSGVVRWYIYYNAPQNRNALEFSVYNETEYFERWRQKSGHISQWQEGSLRELPENTFYLGLIQILGRKFYDESVQR